MQASLIPSWVLLLLLSTLLTVVPLEGASTIMTPNLTPLTFPTLSGSIRDIYTNSSAGIFVVLTTSAIYNLNSSLSGIVDSYTFSAGNYYRIHYELAQSDGYIFLSSSEQLWRFNVANVSANPVSFTINSTRNFQFAIHRLQKYAYVPAQDGVNCQIVDLLTMAEVGRFKYANTLPNFPNQRSGIPGGGWGVAVDSDRSLLYIGVDCWTPTPSYLWQFDISNTANVVLTNTIIHSSDACFEDGFVETGDGRVWYFEDDAGWNGGFDMNDLNFGRDWTVPTTEYVEAFEYVPADHTTFWFDQGSSTYYQGRVYRACNLETMPAGLHEIATWASASDSSSSCGSHWDAPSRTLYAIGCSGKVTTIAVGATDCQQQASSPPKCSSGSVLSSFWLNWFSGLF